MLPAGVPFIFRNHEFILLPQKAIFWSQKQMLIVADVHLGKGGHFRKSGIAIPKELAQDDLAMLSDIIHQYLPKTILFLGDLFHSDINRDWDWFVLWRQLFAKTEMVLIKGNHDIIKQDFYKQLKINVINELEIENLLFTHIPQLSNNTDVYVISGHIHPAIRLTGIARQSATLCCFYFGANQAILPAFGKFTGKVLFDLNEGDKIFAIAGNQIISI